MRKFMTAFLAMIGVMAVGGTAQAGTHSLTANADYAYIGMATPIGGGAKIAVMCWRSSAGATEYLVTLRNGGGTGGLNENVWIDGLAGNDFIHAVRTSSFSPPSNTDCNSQVVAGSWEPLTMGGYNITLDGWTGNDSVEGPPSNSSTTLYGWEGNDFLVNHSSVGVALGEAGDDNIVSSTAGGTDRLEGHEGVDCLWDTSNSATTYDCGSGNDLYHYSNSSIQTNCEYSEICCGVC